MDVVTAAGSRSAVSPPDGPRPDRAAGRGFVGRRRELATIGAAWKRAVTGHGASVLVTGPPGVGKSRLVAEFLASGPGAGDGTVLRAPCTPDPGAPAHWPWAQPLRRSGLRSAAPVPGSGDDPFPFYDAVVSSIRTLSRDRPVAVVVDDAQWADVGSLRLLDLLCRSSADSAVLVVAAHRDDGVSLAPDAAALLGCVGRHGPRLALTGLTRADTAAPPVAVDLVDREGVELIELYGGFEAADAARVIEAIGARAPVGIPSYGYQGATVPGRRGGL